MAYLICLMRVKGLSCATNMSPSHLSLSTQQSGCNTSNQTRRPNKASKSGFHDLISSRPEMESFMASLDMFGVGIQAKENLIHKSGEQIKPLKGVLNRERNNRGQLHVSDTLHRLDF